jgi:hypothetical protein
MAAKAKSEIIFECIGSPYDLVEFLRGKNQLTRERFGMALNACGIADH